MNTQKCTTCGIDKPFNEFWRAAANKSGYKHICKACDKAGRRKQKDTAINEHRAAKLRRLNKKHQAWIASMLKGGQNARV